MAVHPQARGRARFLAAAATLLLPGLVIAGCGSPSGHRPARSSPPAAGSSPASPASPRTTAPAPVTGTWQQLPPAPLTAPLQFSVSVWTGSQLLIHGGYWTTPPKAVTLSYTPATRTWRTLAPGPPPRTLQGRDTAFWTGTEMLVIGLTSAAYNPAANSWRAIPFNGNGATGPAAVWTGRQAIFWGGGCCGGALDSGAAYTPATNSWRPLPPAPLSARYAPGVWTGTEMIVAGGFQPPAVHGAQTLADAAAYNPATRSWRKLAPMPEPRSAGTMVWDGREVVYLGGTLAGGTGPSADALAWQPPAGRWRHLPAMESGRRGFAAVWTGRQVLVWGGYTGSFAAPVLPPHGVAYDPAAGQWAALPMSPLHGRSTPTAVWTGTQLIVWGGIILGAERDSGVSDGAAYQPAAS